LAATLLPGFALTGAYFLFPASIVRTIFTGAYSNPGVVLGLANLAASLYAGLNIWLNYALSLNRPAFIYTLMGVLIWQGLGMFFFGRDSLLHMALVMVSAGLIGNVAGFVTTWFTVEEREVSLAASAV
jgi:ABC-type xylose transport system permease subunit